MLHAVRKASSRGNALKAVLLITALLLLRAGDARAQQEVGHIARIAEKKGHFVDRSQRAELWRTGGDFGLPVQRADPLRYKDIVRLRERIFIELLFRQPTLQTNAYLGSQQLSEVGSYEILQDSVSEVGGLELVVRQGVMVVEHVRGELLTVAAGIRTRIFGTTVLFDVEEGDAEGVVFLHEGHISFPDYDMNETGVDRAWRLQRGQAPVELFLTGQELRRWQQEVKYNSRKVWDGRAFWQKPSFYIPAAAAVVVGGILLFSGGDEYTYDYDY